MERSKIDFSELTVEEDTLTSTPVRPPGLDSFESELSCNYESNNEMSSNIQTPRPLKQRKKRTSSTIAKSKAKTLRSTSSIDENAFFDSNED
ncbi:hypothetical protein BpHYR1_049417, partial [Brachionus plicatilis]